MKTVNCRIPCNKGRIITKYIDIPIYQNGVLLRWESNHETIQCPFNECPINKQLKNENIVDISQPIC